MKPQAPVVTSNLSDLNLAKAIARTVQLIPGIVAINPGVYALEATYGPGEHVEGIVIRHLESQTLEIEVHVIIAVSAITMAFKQEMKEAMYLLQASQPIQDAVVHLMRDMGITDPIRVNVSIDDIQ